jgi:hypothetical protein
VNRSSRKFTLSPIGWAVLLFLLGLAPRLPGLRVFLTSDEQTNLYWAGSQFVEGLLSGDLSLTYWHFYPGVTMSWVETLGLAGAWALARLSDGTAQTLAEFVRRPILDLILAARLPYVLLTAVSVAGFYVLARRLFGHRVALFGALFIAFDPFYLAHSRVAHGDAPVAVFMGLSAMALFVYLHTASRYQARVVPGEKSVRGGGDRRWLILSAVMGALAALTKAPGQFMALFVVLVGAGDWLLACRVPVLEGDLPPKGTYAWVGKRWGLLRPNWRLARRWLVDLVLWGGVAAFLFFALWPAMWVDPAGTLGRMLGETFGKVEEGHLVFFMGQPTLDPGTWFYPYVIPSRLTPVTLVAVLASGLMLVWKLGLARQGNEASSPPGRYMVVALLWFFVVSLLIFGNLSPKKQDRYLLPLFPFLDLLAAFAVVRISESVVQRIGELTGQQGSEATGQRGGRSANQQIGKSANTQHAICSTQHVVRVMIPMLVLLIFHALPILTAYPYYLAYFNPLMGGLRRAVQTTLVGWGEGMEQAAAYLNRRPDADQLYVAAVPAQTFLPYFRGRSENFYTNDVALRADYVVLYVSQVQRLAPSPEIVRYFRAMDAEYTVYVRGVPYAWIYPGPRLITTGVAADATLANVGFGDQLRLAGYRISNLQSPITNLEIVLYWQALAAMSADYTISVRLVAPDGTWLAQRDSWPADGLLPTSQWRQGDFVQDVHTLDLPARVLPGEVAVQIVVYDVATGIAINEPLTLTTLSSGEASP